MKYHSEDESYNRTYPNELTKLSSSNSYNVGSMLVHSPYIPARSIGTTTNRRSTGTSVGVKGGSSSAHKKNKKQITKNKARKKIGTYRRTKRDGDYYDTWKGRISVHMEVEEFDLKLLEKNVLDKTDLFNGKGWEKMAYYDVMRLWLPPSTIEGNDMKAHNITDAPISPGINGAANGGIDYLDEAHIMMDSIEEGHLENGDRVVTQIQDEEGASMPEVYIFSFGAVVFWNFETEENEKAWMSEYLFNTNGNQDGGTDDYNNEEDEDDAIGQQNHPDAIEIASDEMIFIYGTEFRIHRDVAQLQTKEYGEKLAVSFALAKSANLSIFEWRLDQVIERNSHIPEQLAKFGAIHMSRKEISKEIGRIFLVKSGINLENNILDTPEEFWEDEKFHGEYKRAMEYFDIISRLELVNTRLGVMHDMNQILIEAAQSHHSSFLELVVILLIIFEILVEVYRTYRDYHTE